MASSAAAAALHTGFPPSASRGPLPSAASAGRLNDLAAPHVQSFNYLLRSGLADAVRALPARTVRARGGQELRFWVESASIDRPRQPSDASVADTRLLPSECRERGTTYGGELSVTLARTVDGGEVSQSQHKLGLMPIMVRSEGCHLSGLSPRELVAAREEACEFGGYFIVNGNERIVRMLQIPKRNYPMAITRGSWSKKRPLFSDKGVSMRCVRGDQSSVTLVLHYLTDGGGMVRFTVRKQEFFVPVVMLLKALCPTSDREIYERVLAGDAGNTYLSDRLLMLLRDAKQYGAALHSQAAALEHLGARFRSVMDAVDGVSDRGVGQALLDGFVLVHLPPDAPRDKFNLLVLMLRKLYAFVSGVVTEDNADSLVNQELLLSGHLLQVYLKEKLFEFTQVRSGGGRGPHVATLPPLILPPPHPCSTGHRVADQARGRQGGLCCAERSGSCSSCSGDSSGGGDGSGGSGGGRLRSGISSGRERRRMVAPRGGEDALGGRPNHQHARHGQFEDVHGARLDAGAQWGGVGAPTRDCTCTHRPSHPPTPHPTPRWRATQSWRTRSTLSASRRTFAPCTAASSSRR